METSLAAAAFADSVILVYNGSTHLNSLPRFGRKKRTLPSAPSLPVHSPLLHLCRQSKIRESVFV